MVTISRKTGTLFLSVHLVNFTHFRKGEITDLSVHAIVHSTNERMSEKSKATETLYAKAGPKLEAEIKNNIRGRYQSHILTTRCCMAFHV